MNLAGLEKNNVNISDTLNDIQRFIWVQELKFIRVCEVEL